MSEAVGSVRELQARTHKAYRHEGVEPCLSKWAELGLGSPPRVVWFPRQIYPFAATLDQVFEVVENGEIDAILFADERRHSPKNNLRDVIGWLQAPIIDLSGRAGDFADVYFDIGKPETWMETAEVILAHRKKRQQLAPNFRTSVDPELQLLAHAYVSGRPLTAKRYPQAKEAICYPGYWSAGATIAAAEKLVSRGLMKKTFFDKLSECRSCESRRLAVREECPSCRSANLSQTELIHHYHCATLLPEDKFRQGTMLVCPKCRQQLRNYGKDYDKPGQALCCGDCGKTSSEPEVGFVCMDCSARFNGDEARLINIYSYEMTDAGVQLVTKRAGAPNLPTGQPKPVAIAKITYDAKDEVIGQKGEAVFERLRRLFLESMVNLIGSGCEMRTNGPADFIVLFEHGEELAAKLDGYKSASEAILATDIRPRIEVAAKSAPEAR